MKKFLSLAVVLLAALLVFSCAGTKESPIEVLEPIVPSDVQVSVVSEATEPAFAEVIASAPIVSFDDELEYKFSYVYGHLLISNVISQDIKLSIDAFIQGSTDFFTLTEPLIDEYEMANLFDVYQQFFEGTFSEADLEEQAGEPVEQLRSFADKFSYAYGYLIQYNMQMQGIYVNLEGFSSGLADAFYGIELSYSEEEIDQLFDSYQKMLATRYAAMLSEYAADNLADAEAFLLENGQKEDVITTASGLQYKVIEEGTGAKPTDSDTVELDYLLTLLDGSAADSSYSRGEPAVFEVDSLIPGFIEGLKLMNEGSFYRFYVHPSLGYKDVGNEAIPPNSALIFDVELHRILN